MRGRLPGRTDAGERGAQIQLQHDAATALGIRVLTNGNLLDSNRGKNNGDDGLEVSGTGNTLLRNVFNENGDAGICAVSGNVNGGANRATQNGGVQISFAGAC